jgi:outer membrane immunogenic protein
MRSYLVAAAVLCATAIPAAAGDYKGSGPSPWNGAYIGLHLGGAWSSVDWTYANGNTADHSGNGAFGGVQAGYNFRTGGIVVGMEGDFSAASISGGTSCPNNAFSCDSHVSWLGSARLRAGVTMGGVLIYGTGGFGFGHLEMSTTLLSNGATAGSSRNEVGWTAGGGAEFIVDRNWSIKAEYLYYDFGTNTYTVDAAQRIKVDTTIHTGKIGFNYRF